MRLGDRLEEAACALILAVMTAVALANVVTRYLVQYALAFTEEVVVNLFVWLTLLGAAVAVRQGAHLAFTWLVARAPRPLRTAALVLTTALGVGVFLALAWFGVGQIRAERALGTTSEALAIPQWWYTAGVPVFSGLVVVRLLQAAWRTARRG